MKQSRTCKDKGWAWVILGASFLNLLICSIGQSAGVFTMFFIQEYQDESRAMVATCGVLIPSLTTFTGPISSLFIACLGPRKTLALGATMAFLGFTLTYYARSFIHIFFTFGVLAGLGIGTGYATSLYSVGCYFDKYRNIAFGVVLSAMGIGMMGFPPLLDLLYNHYAVKGTILIVGGISTHIFIVALLTLPMPRETVVIETTVLPDLTETKYSNNNLKSKCDIVPEDEIYKECISKQKQEPLIVNTGAKKYDNYEAATIREKLESTLSKYKALLQIKFILYCVFLIVVHMGLSTIRVHFPSFAFEQGTDTDLAAILITVFGLGNTIARISVGFLTNKKKVTMYIVNIICCLITAVLTAMGPYIGVTYSGQVAFSFCFSLIANGFQPIIAPMAIDMVGMENFNVVNGVVLMMSGTGILIGPIIAGWIYDVTSTYFYSFIFAGLEGRRRDALVILCIELFIALTGFSVALRAYLLTANIKAGAFWSHLAFVVACGCYFIGLSLQQQGKTWLVVGMVINVIGILMSFIGTLVDGAQAGHLSQTHFDQCEYNSEADQLISCYHAGPAENHQCQMMVKEDTCYCCYVYRENHCDNWGFSFSTQPNIFVGVSSCSQVEGEYQMLLWASMACNLLQFAVGTVTVSLIGRYKTKLKQTVHPAPSTLQMLVSPSIIAGQLGMAGGPVVFFNQQTVGYFPHSITQPPDYAEAICIGPLPAQPGSHRNSITTSLGAEPARLDSRYQNGSHLPHVDNISVSDPVFAHNSPYKIAYLSPPPAFNDIRAPHRNTEPERFRNRYSNERVSSISTSSDRPHPLIRTRSGENVYFSPLDRDGVSLRSSDMCSVDRLDNIVPPHRTYVYPRVVGGRDGGVLIREDSLPPPYAP